MSQVLQTRCPGCQQALRVPAEWLGQAIRCKQCRKTFVAQPRQGDPAAKPAVKPAAKPSAPPAAPGEKPKVPVAAVVARRKPATPAPPPATPVRRAPDTAPVQGPFEDFSSLDGDGDILPRRRRRGVGVGWVVSAVLLTLTAGGGLGAAYYFRGHLVKLLGTPNQTETAGAGVSDSARSGTSPTPGAAANAVAFPRRALTVCVTNYLYANPVSYGVKDRAGREKTVGHLVTELQRKLHVPANQTAEVSDGDPKTMRLPPRKALVESAVGEFLSTSRPQDRVLLVWIGHAVEVEEQPYLVPVEGELTNKDTLIPLQWLFEKLGACKARQKVLILDVCRTDPGRGEERPTGGALGAKFDEALRKPPEGVQVLASCAAGQFSYESDGRSVFLDKLLEALEKGVASKQGEARRMQQPADPLPVESLAEYVAAATEAEVMGTYKLKQTPRLTGQEVAGDPAYDPRDPAPPPLAFQPPAAGGAASPAEIQKLLEEIDLPPLKAANKEAAPLRLDAVLTFDAAKMGAYAADYQKLDDLLAPAGDGDAKKDKYPLRAEVLRTLQVLRKQPPLLEIFPGTNKAEILDRQKEPARYLDELNEAKDRLDKVGEGRDEEPSRRWQAHYDYVYAQVLARIVYTNEYTLLFGKVRKDELPELDPKIHSGYRMSARDRISSKDMRDLDKQAKAILKKMAKQHAGTPWEILAKRDAGMALGLTWMPAQ